MKWKEAETPPVNRTPVVRSKGGGAHAPPTSPTEEGYVLQPEEGAVLYCRDYSSPSLST